jgi:Bacterial Ig-like domain
MKRVGLIPLFRSALPVTLRTAAWAKGAGVFASFGIFFVLTLANCNNETHFIASKLEICTDGIDNDDNGKADCADSYCSASCVLELTVNPTFQTAADSQLVSGRHKHASKIVVEVLPNYASNGPATLTGLEWSFMARKLAQGNNTLTITATDSAGKSKSVTASIQVQSSN